MSEIKKFGRGAEPVMFEVNGEVYSALPDIPADSIFSVYNAYRNHSTGDQAGGEDAYRSIKTLIETVLYDESASRLLKRMSDKEKPVGIGTITEIIQWLFGEVYGLNPTRK